MKIFLVSSGSYSDRATDGLYSTMEKAEEAKKLFNADNDIEEWELDAAPEHPPGLYRHQVKMNIHGAVDRAELISSERTIQDWVPYGNDSPWVIFSCWARDAEHAIKIANERRLALLAASEWTADWDVWLAIRKARGL